MCCVATKSSPPPHWHINEARGVCPRERGGTPLNSLRGGGGQQGWDFKDAVAAVRKLADCYPQALYSVGTNPNKLEKALSNAMVDGGISG